MTRIREEEDSQSQIGHIFGFPAQPGWKGNVFAMRHDLCQGLTGSKRLREGYLCIAGTTRYFGAEIPYKEGHCRIM